MKKRDGEYCAFTLYLWIFCGSKGKCQTSFLLRTWVSQFQLAVSAWILCLLYYNNNKILSVIILWVFKYTHMREWIKNKKVQRISMRILYNIITILKAHLYWQLRVLIEWKDIVKREKIEESNDKGWNIFFLRSLERHVGKYYFLSSNFRCMCIIFFDS